MVKKTITYVDFNGVERTEDFYFNLTQAELLEMEMSTSGGLAEMIKKIVAAQDTPAVMKLFKDFILKAYGEKSADGRRFIKSEQLSAEFAQTGAYDKLYIELATNTEAATAFINGIAPADVSKNAANANHPALLQK